MAFEKLRTTVFGRPGHHPDYTLMAIIFLLTAFGFVMLASASFELGKIKFNDSYYYLRHQLVNGLLLGFAGFIFASKFYYRRYQKLAVPFLLVSLGLLALVYTNFGVIAGGAGRWVTIGSLTFQPSELLKITFILYAAAWLANANKERERSFWKGFVPFLVVCGVVAGLLFAQPATSTVIILLATGLMMYFVSGVRLRYVFFGIVLIAFTLGVLISTTNYRFTRVVQGFLNAERDPQGSGFHKESALITLGSGRLFGLGYGNSLTKVNRLPASISDSIFAVIGGELGFVGAGSVVALFAFLTLRILYLARSLHERFGKLILVGFALVIALQAFVHMASLSGVLPITGVPLPFISYGGTALAVFLTMGGILTNISKYT